MLGKDRIILTEESNLIHDTLKFLILDHDVLAGVESLGAGSDVVSGEWKERNDLNWNTEVKECLVEWY